MSHVNLRNAIDDYFNRIGELMDSNPSLFDEPLTNEELIQCIDQSMSRTNEINISISGPLTIHITNTGNNC